MDQSVIADNLLYDPNIRTSHPCTTGSTLFGLTVSEAARSVPPLAERQAAHLVAILGVAWMSRRRGILQPEWVSDHGSLVQSSSTTAILKVL